LGLEIGMSWMWICMVLVARDEKAFEYSLILASAEDQAMAVARSLKRLPLW